MAKRRLLTHVALVALAGAPCVLATSYAEAQPGRAKPAPKRAALSPEDAKLGTGIALVEAHDYGAAVTELERLYASTKEPRALYWLGRAHQESGKRAAALRAYAKYLKEAPPSTVQARGVEVLGIMQTLTQQVAIVTVSAPAGATIAVDDVAMGTAPLADPLYVDPGTHKIAATSGTTTASKTIEAAEDGRVTLDLTSPDKPSAAATLPPAPPTERSPAAPAPAPAPAPESSSPSSGPSALTIGGITTATLLAAGSVFFAIKAAGTASDFDSKKTEFGVERSTLDDLQGKTRLQAGLSLGLGLGALGVAGLTLFVLKKPSASAASVPPPSRVVVTGQGFALAGSF